MERLGGDRRQGDEPVRARQRAGGQAEAVHHGRDQDLRSRAGRLYDVVALSRNRSVYEGVLDWTWLGMALGLSYMQIALETMEYISLDIPLGLFFAEGNLLQREECISTYILMFNRSQSEHWTISALHI